MDRIIDDGPCLVGLESTVVDCTSNTPVVLRPGGVTSEQIESIAGSVAVSDGSPNKPASPGMLQSHYAPDAAIRLNATSVDVEEALLSFGAHRLSDIGMERNLSPTANLQEAAQPVQDVAGAGRRRRPHRRHAGSPTRVSDAP